MPAITLLSAVFVVGFEQLVQPLRRAELRGHHLGYWRGHGAGHGATDPDGGEQLYRHDHHRRGR